MVQREASDIWDDKIQMVDTYSVELRSYKGKKKTHSYVVQRLQLLSISTLS